MIGLGLRSTFTVVLLAVTVGCGGQAVRLPDRGAPDVIAEEARLSALLARPGVIFTGRGTCQVRLLGRETASSFAWVACEYETEAGTPLSGLSMPVRVDGDTVTIPEDGSGYSPSVRRMFPRRLAALALSNPDSLRP